jgi:mevalonate kinase
MKTIISTAPGKIILSGEHSVGYGKPALVSAVDLKMTVTITESKTLILDPQIEKAVQSIQKIVLSYLNKEKKIEEKPYRLTIESDIPQGRGMGSSAAFCVAVSGALLEFYGERQFDKQVINSLAYKAETFFHGFPSGVDVSASCHGGLIFYRKEFEFLKQISALPFKIPEVIQKNLVLIDSGMPAEPTSEMIAHVGKRYNTHPELMEKTFIEIEKCTKRMVISIMKEDPQMFFETIQTNGALVEDMGIVSDDTKELLQSLTQYGKGKVTGAGGKEKGSGMVLFFADDMNGLAEYLKEKKIWFALFHQDFQGVHVSTEP